MLILSRREAECICLGDDIVLTIVSVGRDKVRIGVKAPPGVRILRNELEVTAEGLAIPFPSSTTDDLAQEEAPVSISCRRVA